MSDTATEERRLAAIMFTDMVGFSALAQKNEALALELLTDQQRLLRREFAEFNGREVKVTGDGFLVEFPSALAATRCAVEIQKAIAARNATQPAVREFQVRIGLHVGDVVHREADMFGDGVNIAARIEPLAASGGICLSGTVHAQVSNKLDLPLVKLDSADMKNITTPMEVYRVTLPWEIQTAEYRFPAKRGIRSPRIQFAVAGVIVVSLLAGFGSRFLNRGGTSKQAATSAGVSPADEKSVAVLPFVNMSSDKENEYLSDGITEELLNALAKVPGLFVPARTSSFAFKGKYEDIRKIGELLHVQSVLEGSVRKSGNQLRITAQLIRVSDGSHLWSETYDRKAADIFATESDIAERIANRLRLTIGPRRIARGPRNVDAWQVFLKGKHAARWTREGLRTAIDHFKAALQLQPDLAEANVALADAYFDQQYFGYESPQAVLPLIYSAIRKALEQNDGFPEAHDFLGLVKLFLEWDWAGAEREFNTAILLDSAEGAQNAGFHYNRALLLVALGRYEEAKSDFATCQKLDPLNSSMWADFGFTLMCAGDTQRALQISKYAVSIDPSYWFVHEALALVLIHLGNRPEALTELKSAVRLDSGSRQLASLGRLYGATGQADEARKVLHQLVERRKTSYVHAYCFAWVYEGLGNYKQANDWMLRAIKDHESELVFLKAEEDDLNRRNPFFQDWLKRIGLHQ